MLHPGPLTAAGAVDVAAESGASAAIDLAAAAERGERGFLRAAWYAAAAGDRPLTTVIARSAATGEVVAAVALTPRRLGPLAIREVAGSYWPYRSVPIARDADEAELAGLLGSTAFRKSAGRAWRLGPVYADDRAGRMLVAAARNSGWKVATRRLGTCYEVDLAGLAAAGPWPSSKTLRKNRWLERRLAEAGELSFTSVSGEGWTAAVFDVLAAIEKESWVGRRAAPLDAKFLHADNRRLWQRAVGDPLLAERLFCSLLHVGGVPAAFTFGLRSGDTLHFIANSYSERFADRSPGRILLYRDLQAAAETGVARVGWGAGDPGYKTEMGARPGPAIVDHLFMRGPLAAAARLLWRTKGG